MSLRLLVPLRSVLASAGRLGLPGRDGSKEEEKRTPDVCEAKAAGAGGVEAAAAFRSNGRREGGGEKGGGPASRSHASEKSEQRT